LGGYPMDEAGVARRKLTGKVCFVTGSRRGIGRAIAVAFAHEGANVIVNYRPGREPPDDLVKELEAESGGAKALAVIGDVSEEADVRRVVDEIIAEFGHIDVLVNNAGISGGKDFVDLTVEEWDRMIKNNLRSTFLCTRFVAPWMIKQRYGRIINISSQTGQRGDAREAPYAASKAAQIGFTKSLARELGVYNITVNAIAPGPVLTDMLKWHDAEWFEEMKARLPLGRLGEPEEVAPSAVFLASDDGALYTGQTLGPNCGDVML
jgi:3-oxoacyl-[acyl-carrier protein] reductase